MPLRRIAFVASLACSAVVLTLLFQGVWAGLVITNLKTSPAIPWAVALMALLVWPVWKYLGGAGWPQSTAAARRGYLRANSLSRESFGWALITGLLTIVALAGCWIVMFQLVKIPGNRLLDFSSYPLLTVVLVLTMAAAVGAIAEEAGFRGYVQVALEREFRAPVAIVISALLMSPGHGLTQGFLWPTLLWYFFVDVALGATAYLTNSILPGILIHGAGLLLFFTLVWPADRSRQLVTDGGADAWFWIHIGQTIVFAVLAVLAFRHLARVTASERSKS